MSAYLDSLLAALADRDPFQVLRETPAALHQAIAGMSEAQLAQPEAAGKWSVNQLLHHLADSELVGGFRFRMILAEDRPTLPGYDQDRWVALLHAGDTDAHSSLESFGMLRAGNLRLLTRTTAAERERVGLHTERGEESLGFLLRIYAGHDLVHRRQLARIRKQVGG